MKISPFSLSSACKKSQFALLCAVFLFLSACGSGGDKTLGEYTEEQETSNLQSRSLNSANLTISRDNQSLVLNWTITESDFSYSLFRGTSYEFGDAEELASGISQNRFVDDSPKLNQQYYYFLKVCDADSCSESSQPVAAALVAAPETIDSTNQEAALRLEWEVNLLADTYSIYRSLSAGDIPNSPLSQNLITNSFLDKTPQADTPYFYFVQACNQQGCSNLSEGHSSILINPPQNLSANKQNQDISLSWTANGLANSYRIFRGNTANFADATLLEQDLSSTSFVDQSAQPNTSYFYFAQACVDEFCSVASAGINAVLLTSPANLQANSLENAINLQWQGNNLASSYKVLRSTTASFANASLLGSEVSANSFVDAEAQADTVYFYFVQACHAIGCSDVSNPINASRLSAAINLELTRQDSSLKLDWQANSLAINYKVFRGETDNFAQSSLLAEEVSANSYLDTSAGLDTSYFYFVQACNANGCSDSSQGNAALLSIPQDLQATAENNAINISWTANQLASSYKIYRGSTNSFESANLLADNLASSSYLDTSADVGTSYFYFVEACNSSGCSEPSASASAALLSSPENLQVTKQQSNAALSWNAMSLALNYKIYRGQSDNFAQASLLAEQVSTNSYLDTTAELDTSYFYFVEACNENGCSAASSSVNAVLLSQPSMVAASKQDSHISLSWGNKQFASSYSILRATTNDFNTAVLLSDSETTNSFVDQSVELDTTYFYFVQACNQNGCSDSSPGFEASLISQPINLTALRQDNDLSLNWDAKPLATSYTIKRNTTNDFATASLLSNAATSNSFEDINPTLDTSYFYFVEACNATGCSESSDGLDASLISPPTDLQASKQGNSLSLAWEAKSLASSYKILRNTTNDFSTSSLLTDSATSSSFVDATLEADTSYFYFIEACNQQGCSDASTGLEASLISQPSSLTASRQGADLSLSWDANPLATSYTIKRNTTNDFTSSSLLSDSTTSNSFVDSNPQVDTAYFYFIQACNQNGCSESSNSLEAALLRAPSNMQATSLENAINLNWDANSLASSYKIYRNTSNDFSTANLLSDTIASNSYNDSTAEENTTYFYFAQACNENGCSDQSFGLNAALLAGSVNLETTRQADDMNLSWEANALVSYYKIYRGLTNNQADASLLADNITTNSYLDSSASLDTRYFYFIEACNSSGCNDAAQGNASLLRKPADVAAVRQSNALNISWAANQLSSSYKVYRSNTNSFADASLLGDEVSSSSYLDSSAQLDTSYFYFVEACNSSGCSDVSDAISATLLSQALNLVASKQGTSISLAWDSNPLATSYTIKRNTTNDFANASLLSDSPTSNSYVDTSPSLDTEYFYFVQACNQQGCSVASSGLDAALLSSPINLAASKQNSALNTSWNANTLATSYKISRNTANDPATANLLNGNITTNSFVDTTAQVGTVYFYFLEACNQQGCSEVSSPLEASLMAKPTNLAASKQNANLSLTWNADALATSYKIFRNTSNDAATATELVASLASNSFVDTTPQIDTEYFYFVEACNQNGCSEASNAANAALLSPATNLAAVKQGNSLSLTWDALPLATYYSVSRSTSDDAATASLLDGSLPSNSFVDATPVADTEYFYFVQACNQNGCSDASNSLKAAVLVSPTNLTASKQGSDMSLSWDANSLATSYRISRNTLDDFASASLLEASAASNSFVDTSPDLDTSYFYFVEACNDNGCSDASDSANAALLSQAANLSATKQGNNLSLAWDANSLATSYKILRNTSDDAGSASLLSSSATSNSFVDSTAQQDTGYFYFVEACNANGCSDISASLEAVVVSIPTGLAASKQGNDISLNWDANSLATSYTISRNTANDFATATELSDSISSNSFVDSSPQIDTEYFYFVQACNANGCSDASTGMSAALLSSPVNLAASKQGNGLSLSWDAHSLATSYSISRNTSNDFATATLLSDSLTGNSFVDTAASVGTTYFYFIQACNLNGCSDASLSLNAVLLTTPNNLAASRQGNDLSLSWDTNALASSYSIFRSTSNDFAQASLLSDSLSSNSFTDTNASLDTSYFYFVQACNLNGCSDASNGLNAALLESPSNLAASRQGTNLSLSWDANSLASTYSIFRSTSNDFAQASLLSDSLASNSFADSTASIDTTYFYFIQACNDQGCSDASTGMSAALLSSPVNLAASKQGNGLSLSWDAHSLATSYTISRNTANDFATATLLSDSATSNSFVDANPIADTDYFYFVQACNQNGCSDASGGLNAALMTKPVNLSASKQGNDMNLSWDANSLATSYKISRNTSNDFASANLLSDNLSTNAFTDSTTQEGISYFYFVEACNQNGCSDASDALQAGVVSTATNLKATRQNTSLSLDWDAPPLTTYYRVSRNTSDSFAGASLLSGNVASNSYVDTSPVLDTEYFYFVESCNANGCGDASTSLSAALLSQASNLSATRQNDDLSLTWDANSLATSYKISRNTSNDFASASLLSDTASTNNFVDTTASLDTTYFYFVEACNANGCSDVSNALEASLISQPTNLTASRQNSDMSLAWDSNALASSYSIFRSTTNDFAQASLLSSSATSNSFVDTGVSLDTSYFYFVQACNTHGCSDASGATNAALLSQASNLAATKQNNNLSLVWTANSLATSYKISRNTSSHAATASLLSDTLTGNAYVDSTAQLGTVYFYFVEACNANGCGDVSSPVEASLISQPSNLAASKQASSMSLAWDADSLATSYKISRNTANDFASASLLTASATSNSFVDTSPSLDTSYFYFVEACNANGCSDASSGLNAALLSQATNLSATKQANNLNLSWDANSLATSYKISKNTSDDAASASLLTASATSNSFVDTGAQVDTAYFYFVEACNANGCSDISASLEGVVVSIPTSLAASKQNSSLSLAWDANAFASSYKVLRNTSNDSASATQLTDSATSNSFVDSSPSIDTEYFYFVQTCNEQGCSDASSGSQAALLSSPVTLDASNQDAKITLSWDANSLASSYSISRATSDDFSTASLLSNSATSNSFEDTTALEDTTYFYFVNACNANGCSETFQ